MNSSLMRVRESLDRIEYIHKGNKDIERHNNWALKRQARDRYPLACNCKTPCLQVHDKQ